MSDWRIYERFVANLMANQTDQDLTVVPNAKLVGRLSGAIRQIDVLIDFRYESHSSRRTIVDAKMHKRPIDVKQVEEFEGMMKDVGAHRGILVCPNGHTAAALRRAQDAISIKLVPISDLNSFDLTDYDPCSHAACDGLVLWDTTPSLEMDGTSVIFATSKCDECRRFNIWCWGCGQKFALNDEDEKQCSCKGPWFWLTAIEGDMASEQELDSVHLFLIYGTDGVANIDRRPLR